MKLNTTPKHYMPLSQSQSDDDESGPTKEDKINKISFKNSFMAASKLSKDSSHIEIYEVDPKSLPMTKLRRICFILSLILCVLFIFTFVFLVPCSKTNLHGTCHLTKRWRNVHYNMSFISPLDFVHSEILGSYIVILGYMNNESGLIAIEGPTGKERWRLSLHSTPTSSICNEIDVNSDGFPDCIVIGNNGLLTAVDLKKGTSLWYLHNHNNLHAVTSVHRPMLTPDCDNDSIRDLFLPYINNGDKNVHLGLVSGGTGQIIGSLLEIPQCMGPVTAHFMWKTQNETDFILYCAGANNGGNLWLLSSKSLCDVAMNWTDRLVLENVFSLPKFAKNAHFYKLSASDNHLVLVLNENEVMLLIKSPFTFHAVWKIHLENHKDIRILTDGHFSEDNNQLIILSNYLTRAKVMGLNLKNGKEVWSIIQDKGNITLALKLPKFFANTDGLILKVVSSFHPEVEEKNMESNLTTKEKKLSKSNINGTITQLKENYVLVKPDKVPLVTDLSTEEIWSLCEENTCKPDVYTSNVTVLANASKLGISVDMLAVSFSLHPTNNSTPLKEAFVKYWRLENLCYISRCNL